MRFLLPGPAEADIRLGATPADGGAMTAISRFSSSGRLPRLCSARHGELGWGGGWQRQARRQQTMSALLLRHGESGWGGRTAARDCLALAPLTPAPDGQPNMLLPHQQTTVLTLSSHAPAPGVTDPVCTSPAMGSQAGAERTATDALRLFSPVPD